jgi:hypothetical protein
MHRSLLTGAAILSLLAVPAQAAVSYAGHLTVAGDASDLAPGSGANQTRLSFGSDLTYDSRTGTFYGISDRGPGGGLVDWAPRIEAFKADFASTGAVSNFQLQKTVLFRQANGAVYSGLRPDLLPGGNSANLANSLDSEGIVKLRNGQFLVADEYGPSVYLTDRNGKFLRAFTPPDNILPKSGTTPNFSDGRNVVQPGGTPITQGRQDNRGFEGLTVNAEGTKAWAILQDPLVNEGASNDGRRSRNLRIVEYDVATGQSTAQYIYQLEALADINARIPGTSNDFAATAQGRNIGVSSITWIGGTTFLVIERDNRGVGVDNYDGTTPVGSKRVFLIDLAGASDVSGVSLAGTNTLPAGTNPVSKTLFLDVQAELGTKGVTIAEKMEGLAIGPRLAGGGFALLIATDNDFSVTQTGSGEQFDVCSATVQVAIGAGCPSGKLLPSYLYSFAVTGADAAYFDASLFSVPEPSSWAMLIAGFGLTGAAMRRRRMRTVTA